MMQQLLVFMNAHLALDASNSVAMVVASPPRPGVPNSGRYWHIANPHKPLRRHTHPWLVYQRSRAGLIRGLELRGSRARTRA